MTTSEGNSSCCAAVDEHITRPIPSVLWHYTSFHSLISIVQSKQIWATDYHYLNDSEEFLHARNLASELLEGEPELDDEGYPARDVIRSAVDLAFNVGQLDQKKLLLMVASFSEGSDQLSQWRGYSKKSTGVSIGFDLSRIRPTFHPGTTAIFAPCIYNDTQKSVLIKAIYANHLESMKPYWTSFYALVKQERTPNMPAMSEEELVQTYHTHASEHEHILAGCIMQLQLDLLRVAPLLKNSAFSEEKEWRLVIPIEVNTIPHYYAVDFFARDNCVVPYIAYPLTLNTGEDSVPVVDLILGPGSHVSSEFALNLFLKTQQISASVRSSKVPYRPS